jgi:formylglycine-generating enzyme required for sulfatase activity
MAGEGKLIKKKFGELSRASISFLIFSMMLFIPPSSWAELVTGKVKFVQKNVIELDIGKENGLEVGAAGRVYYTITVEGEEKPIYIAKFKVIGVSENSCKSQVLEKNSDIKIGYLAEVLIKGCEIEIKSNPPEARVFMDGKEMGETPIVLSNVYPKQHLIQIVKKGYLPYKESILVKGGERKTVNALLRKEIEEGYLVVRTGFEGGKTYINGNPVESTLLKDRIKLPEGVYKVKVEKEGYKAWEVEVSVKAEKTVEVHAHMKKALNGASEEIWTEPITGIEFVWIYGGCFDMGSPWGEEGRFPDEGPVHEVCVDGFWIGKYEVTNGSYRKFRAEHDSKSYQGNSLNGDNQPVVNISWEDAKAFADWLTKQYGGQNLFRLPREAEWEYACRAGTKTARYWGDNPHEACKHENVADQTAKRHWSHFITHNCDDGYPVTAPVGRFQPNPFGLYDMLGNVMEWCEDVYNKDAYSKHQQKKPFYTDEGLFRVSRGGSWYYEPSNGRCAYRHSDSHANERTIDQGFRLVMQP